jgi:hypothetical protein
MDFGFLGLGKVRATRFSKGVMNDNFLITSKKGKYFLIDI